MNRPHEIKALREALKQHGGWDQLHRASVLVDGVLVVRKPDIKPDILPRSVRSG